MPPIVRQLRRPPYVAEVAQDLNMVQVRIDAIQLMPAAGADQEPVPIVPRIHRHVIEPFTSLLCAEDQPVPSSAKQSGASDADMGTDVATVTAAPTRAPAAHMDIDTSFSSMLAALDQRHSIPMERYDNMSSRSDPPAYLFPDDSAGCSSETSGQPGMLAR